MRYLLWLIIFSFECVSETRFVDLNTGYMLRLNPKAGTYTIHDQKAPADFCGDESEYVCMKSIHINFAIPKKQSMQDKWELNGLTYCYIDVFDYEISSGWFDEVYLVAISQDGLCNDLSGKEARFLYGRKVGLIYIDSFSLTGYQRRFVSLDVVHVINN